MRKRLTAALMAGIMCFSVVSSGYFVRAEEIGIGEEIEDVITDPAEPESEFPDADLPEEDAEADPSGEDAEFNEYAGCDGIEWSDVIYVDEEEVRHDSGIIDVVPVTDPDAEAEETVRDIVDEIYEDVCEDYSVNIIQPRMTITERPEDGTTYGQPFASGTGGSANFRIPALVTLSDGTLVAAADARWNHSSDGYGLDTIVSRSSDNGATWDYTFANYLGDYGNVYNVSSTAFIDPALATDGSTLWMLVDLYPGGTAIGNCRIGTGYDSSGHLLLSTDNCSTFGYYVGDCEDDGYAGIFASDGTQVEGLKVDRWFNLYQNDEKISNVFFKECSYRVFQTSYLYLTRSDDRGRTWSAPVMLNPQVKDSGYKFYGVGPGRGLVTSTGRIMFACYTYMSADGNTSVIYSDDGGVTWKAGESVSDQTSEATMVEVNGRIYMFTRHGGYYVSDDYGETWSSKKSVGVTYNAGCQIDAIVYSKTIDGRKAILLSAPSNTGSRSNGKIFVGLVLDDGTISWDYTYPVTESGGYYAYSCMSETSDGDIALLYENAGASIKFSKIPIGEIAAGSEINGPRRITVPLYGSVTIMDSALAAWEPDTDIVSVTKNGNYVTLRGISEGTCTFTLGNDTVIIEVKAGEVVEISLSAGDSEEIMVNGSEFCQEPDASVASADLKSGSFIDYYGYQTGSLAVNAGNSADTGDVYYGDTVPLENALYTFDRNSDGSYIVHANTSEGVPVYVSYRQPSPKMPNDTSSTGKVEVSGSNGEFHLHITNVNTSNQRYLYFYRNGNNIFDANSTLDGERTNFYLYRPAEEGETGSDELYGYVRMYGTDEIADGGRYLIVAHYTSGGSDHYYALYPSSKNSENTHISSHVIRVNNSSDKINVLTLTGKSSGTTDVCVGGVIYRITVTGDIQEPAELVPAEPIPGELVPAQPIPGELVPAQPIPGELVPAQPIPGELVPAQPVKPDGSGAVVPVTGNGIGNKTENSGNSTVNNKGESSETADMAHPAAAVLFICLSGVGLAVLTLTGRKKRSVR